jgi:ABC-type lipoprotein export system ATPase subunit/GNAT superfamily N-acetyltransferase
MGQKKMSNLFESQEENIVIRKSTTFDSTERNNYICKMYDINFNEIKDEFIANFDVDFEWNIGLIVGQSGTGKTTIATDKFKDFYLFKEHFWDSKKSIVDNFNNDLSSDKIIESLTKVGFSSPLNWLKPYQLLSNGQKMRVDLARLLLENTQTVIFDEFTSVVDRDVAKITSLAVSDFIRKNNYKFIAVSCHSDIKEWLRPDWIFDTNEKKFSRGFLWQRPAIEFKLRTAKIDEWKIFSNYHYLTHDIQSGSDCYALDYLGYPIAFVAVNHFPHPKVANFKKIHRMVVLPDFQGIGIGKKLLNAIAEIYFKENYRVLITTGALSFIKSLGKEQYWKLTRKLGKVGESKGVMKGKTSMNRETASFEYKECDTKTLNDSILTYDLF